MNQQNVPFHSLSGNQSANVFIHGEQVPDILVEKSGVWIQAAGSAMLSPGEYQVIPADHWLWIATETGDAAFSWNNIAFPIEESECLILPPHVEGASLHLEKDCKLIWFSLSGFLANEFLQSMNALSNMPVRQGMLPSQVNLMHQIVQVMVRHSGTSNASFQLQQLLWSMIAAHAGQPVAMNAILSHEICRVVDTLRANDYADNFSLAEMADISRVPVETFRKRFVSEVGIPPLSYLQFCKMERAKKLLRLGISVREAGVKIGMSDPYHFSKQFKRVVGMSPTAYLKHVDGANRKRSKRRRGIKMNDSL
ncbi:MAG: AraC family transcriptional regulator [Eubacteriales bacterium]|nr:AraC family transcriptional regulator [Eubacteriales bacterium]